MSIIDVLEKSKKDDAIVNGVVIGIVTNNQDPDGLGRVKVKIPRLSGEDESNWARVVSFMAGKDRGAFFLPEVDDEVLIAFEYGDINMPYVIGSLWNGKDTPPEDNSDGENKIRVIKSRSGHVIRLNDKDGEEMIEIVDKSEKNSIVINTKDNKIEIKSEKDLSINAPNGKITMEGKDIEIKTSSSTKIESESSMDIKSSATLNIKGSTVNIN